MRAEFDEFCTAFDEVGMTTVNPKSLANRIDPELVQQWVETVLEPGRVEGQHDPAKRLAELEHQGIAGEVVFPDFGLPFELHPPLVAAIVGYRRTPAQVEAANRAYNRWLADFCATASGALRRAGGAQLRRPRGDRERDPRRERSRAQGHRAARHEREHPAVRPALRAGLERSRGTADAGLLAHRDLVDHRSSLPGHAAGGAAPGLRAADHDRPGLLLHPADPDPHDLGRRPRAAPGPAHGADRAGDRLGHQRAARDGLLLVRQLPAPRRARRS